MKFEVANFLLFITDAGICVFTIMVVYGLLKNRIYALGQWFYRSDRKPQFIQALLGYAALAVVLIYFRIFVYPENLFQYLVP